MKKEFPIKKKTMAAPKKGSKEAQLKMQFVRDAKKQTGTSNTEIDKQRQAMQPGKRKSQYGGGTYYEYRANRIDKGVLLGIKDLINNVLEIDIVKDYNYTSNCIKIYEFQQIQLKESLKKPENKLYKVQLNKNLTLVNKYVTEMKQHLKELKKLM
jgi:hypothetical protein